jgi:hypothetical protein
LAEQAAKVEAGAGVTPRRMPRRGKLLFGAIAIVMAAVGATTVLLAADLYLHRRAERSAGLNRWGYRGPVIGRKTANETRVAMLGGSTVFGYGVFHDQTIPAQLERILQSSEVGAPVSVVNLGFNNEGAHALAPTLVDFDYLDIDIAVLYTGYNDWWGDVSPNTAVYRHESPVFRMFGYYPILPLVLKEKAIVFRTGGQLIAAHSAETLGTPKPVFSPSLADRTSAAAIETVVSVTEGLGAQLDRLSRKPAVALPSSVAACAAPWATYCDSLYRAIQLGRSKGMTMVVALPPVMTKDTRDRHLDQQRATVDMVARHFSEDPHVLAVDLSKAVDLEDRHYSFDAMHLDQDGNAVLAQALAPHLRPLIGS